MDEIDETKVEVDKTKTKTKTEVEVEVEDMIVMAGYMLFMAYYMS